MPARAREGISVLFYADLTSPFVPRDLDVKPLGGSETALVHVARGLAALGHRVMVVSHPGTGTGVYDGVEYLDVKSHSWGRVDVDVAVVFRQLPHVRRRLPGQARVLWVHDGIGIFPELNSGARRWVFTAAWKFGHRVFGSSVNGIVAVSRWLGNCFVKYARWPVETVWTIPNGIDPVLFPRKPTGSSGLRAGSDRQPRIAYTSRPERGLSLLVTRIMPQLWQAIPSLELHVFSYSSLDDYRHLASGNASRVHFRGGLRQADLARELQDFDLWVYPTNTPETSCIAAMEAQAAGVPVISSRRYALQETVQDGHSHRRCRRL